MEEQMYLDEVWYMNEDKYMYEYMYTDEDMNEEEQWRDVPGYEGLYSVSDKSEIYSMETGIDMKQQLNHKDYCTITLYKDGKRKTYKSHRLSSAAFIANPLNKPQINHRNGIHYDNRIENLEWCTDKENSEHARRMGLINNQTRLPKEDIMYIRDNHVPYSKEFGAKAMARRFGVSDQYILKIVKPETDISLYIAV